MFFIFARSANNFSNRGFSFTSRGFAEFAGLLCGWVILPNHRSFPRVTQAIIGVNIRKPERFNMDTIKTVDNTHMH